MAKQTQQTRQAVKLPPAKPQRRKDNGHQQKEKEETMAKTPAVQEQHRQVAKKPVNIMDPVLLKRMQTDAGKGLSKDASDNLVPLIYLLQPLSPQVMKGDPARIEGAEAGDIYLRNAEDPIIKGEDGMLFQPSHFWKDIVEWQPDRQGFVARHDISCLPNKEENKGWTGTLKDVQEIPDEEDPNAWPRYVRKSNNNEVVETRYFAGNVYFDDGRAPLPFIIPLSSTGHSFGKQWMFLQNSQTFPDGSSTPSWAFIYRLTTKMKTNNKGSWYSYSVQKERALDYSDAVIKNDVVVSLGSEYERGAALNQAFTTGKKKIDDEMMDASRPGAPAGDLDNNEM
jgi:hypothetical protein